MLQRCAAILSPQPRRQGAKPVQQHVTVIKRHFCLSVLARSSNNAVDAIRKGLVHIPDADLQQALAEYPDLGEVDEEYVALWLTSAASLLNLTADDVQSYVRVHPWLLISDLLVIKTLVIALTRVMSVDERQVARMALSHPDILELEPMDLMEHLVYLSNTTGLSYNAVVQLTLGCPAIALSQPRDVVRAWAQIRSCCSQSEMATGATTAATRDADRAQADYGRQEELGGNLETSNKDELEDDFDLEAAVLKVLAARPQLLTMGNEEIRKSLAPVEAAGAPTVAAAAPSLRTSARPQSTVAGATPLPRPTPLPPSKLLRPRAVRRRVPRKVTRDGGSGAGGEGENAADSDKVAIDPQ